MSIYGVPITRTDADDLIKLREDIMTRSLASIGTGMSTRTDSFKTKDQAFFNAGENTFIFSKKLIDDLFIPGTCRDDKPLDSIAVILCAEGTESFAPTVLVAACSTEDGISNVILRTADVTKPAVETPPKQTESALP